MLSFAATLCFFFIIKVTFLFFPMTFSVSTVHFSKFILFGGKQSFFTLAVAIVNRGKWL